MFYPTIYSKDGIRFNKNVKHLILREGVTTIEEYAFYNGGNYQASEKDCVFESVVFPKTLKTVGDQSFYGCYKLNFNLPDFLEEIGDCSFQNTLYSPDTLKLPQSLKIYYMSAFPLKEKQVIIIPQNVEQVYNYKKAYNNSQNIYYYSAYLTSENCSSIYIYATNPPKVIDYSGNTFNGVGGGLSFKGFTIYVPKGTSADYLSAESWKNATIIENILAEDINISNLPTDIFVGDNIKLVVDVTPSDALNKNFTLSVSDDDIATISNDGTLIAKRNGKVTITASSSDGAVTKSIILNIYDHTTGVTISKESLTMNLGATETLSASTLPLETSDGKVKWKSADERVAIVNDKGTVVAVGYGTTVIIVTSVDGDYVATCTVQVTEGTDISTPKTKNKYKIYDLNGIEKRGYKPGINILKFDDGTTKKTVIKK